MGDQGFEVTILYKTSVFTFYIYIVQENIQSELQPYNMRVATQRGHRFSIWWGLTTITYLGTDNAIGIRQFLMAARPCSK